ALERARLDWSLLADPTHGAWLDVHRALLAVRRREIVPRLGGLARGDAVHALHGGRVVEVRWRLSGGAVLQLLAWLGGDPVDGLALRLVGRPLHSTAPRVGGGEGIRALPRWFVSFSLAAGSEAR